MAKNSIRDYSATNSANTDIQSIDISEGCSPAGINNAIREVMADLKDVSTGAVALESPAMDSASLTGDLTFGDNDKAIFGAGSDLQIYHDGTHSYIKDAGTGQLRILATDLRINNTANDKSYITGTDGAEISLYHNGSGKLATTATGVDVTGGLTTTGNVGIGVTPFANNIGNGLDIASGAGMFGSSNSNYLTGNLYYSSGWKYKASAGGALILLDSASSIKFNTAASGTAGGAATLNERMRIDSSGSLLLGKTSTSDTTVGCHIEPAYGGYKAIAGSIWPWGVMVNRQDNDGSAITLRRANTTVGSITVNSSSTSYNTSSDYRLKENVTADWDATTRLKQLNPVRFNFIADADTTVDGFLAHEVQDIVPEAISGTKDGMMDEEYTVSAATGDIYTPAVEATYDEDGVELTAAIDEVIHSADVERPEELAEGQLWRETTAAVMGTRSVPDYQGIDQSKLVPLLVKTIQELEARITALEAN